MGSSTKFGHFQAKGSKCTERTYLGLPTDCQTNSPAFFKGGVEIIIRSFESRAFTFFFFLAGIGIAYFAKNEILKFKMFHLIFFNVKGVHDIETTLPDILSCSFIF